MLQQIFPTFFYMVRRCFCLGFLFFSFPLHASFIESTVGTAVVDDATATYYNPASLTRLKKTQLVALGSIGSYQTQFSGLSTQLTTNYKQFGTSHSREYDLLPSFYFGMPVTNHILVGLAVVANDFNRDIDNHSILRYVQSSNKIQDVDLVPAVGYKFNEFISLGAGLNRSHANFLLQPISGLPSLNIPDSQSRNESSADGWGGDVGLLLKPTVATMLGFNYRSAITYEMNGKSTFNGNPSITSDNYRFNYWTPARSVLSISQAVTPQIGLIGTIQYIQWDIFKKVTLHNIATNRGIVPSSMVHYNFHNAWIITFGSNYRMSSKWIIRGAGSYMQSPSNGRFQVDNGDSMTLGASIGYTMFENFIIDCSYAHAFIKDQAIRTTTTQTSVNGINKGSRDAFALKLTINV